MTMEWVVALWGVWNGVVFLLYGWDKKKARQRAWRVSEKTLIGLAVMMGGVGALAGMQVFRHKTKHLKFQVGVPLALVVNAAIAMAYLFYIGVL